MIQDLLIAVSPLRQKLTSHSVYRAVRVMDQLHVFMQMHVFAVWDFMSLLKALQRGLTCVDVPWIPARHFASRLVNAIVLDEESDIGPDGESISHFDLYRKAMRDCNCSTEGIDNFVDLVAMGNPVEDALHKAGVPEPARAFVSSTFTTIGQSKLHGIAAAFTFGREDIIPDIFRAMIGAMARATPGLESFHYYLERHIELDGDDHGPQAHRMLESLCGTSEERWAEATAAAQAALEARLMLWDGIVSQMPQRPASARVSVHAATFKGTQSAGSPSRPASQYS